VKKYPKIVQCDKRGQIVIPKDIRQELDIDEGTGFWMFSISDEGVLLKKIPAQELKEYDPLVTKIKEKADAIGLKKELLDDTVKKYKRTKQGKLEVLE